MPAAVIRHPGASQSSTTGSFETFVDTAMKFGRRGSRECALDLGVDEPALLRYASGAVSVYERQEIQNVLVRNEWAMNFVVQAVKARRKKQAERCAA